MADAAPLRSAAIPAHQEGAIRPINYSVGNLFRR